jgi:transposase
LIRLEEWVDIVSRHNAGQSIRSIARDLDISRNTVRATLRREGPPHYERRAAPSKLDAHRDYLIARLAEFPELSAKRLLAEIRAQGYAGGISILKDFTRPYRVPRKRPVVRFETPPGKQAQCDFGELGLHEVCGTRTRVYLFVMVLGFSRFMYTEATSDTRSETFLACHARAFAYFGGMPAEVLLRQRQDRRSGALAHGRDLQRGAARLRRTVCLPATSLPSGTSPDQGQGRAHDRLRQRLRARRSHLHRSCRHERPAAYLA